MRKRKGNRAFWMGLGVMFLTINMSSYALSEAVPESIGDNIKPDPGSVNTETGKTLLIAVRPNTTAPRRVAAVPFFVKRGVCDLQ